MPADNKNNKDAFQRRVVQEAAKVWITKILSRITEGSSTQNECEDTLSLLLNEFPKFSRPEENKPSLIDRVLEQVIKEGVLHEIATLQTIELFLKAGAYTPHLSDLQTFLPESCDLAELTLFSPRLIFHIVMQKNLRPTGEHRLYERVIRQCYAKLTPPEYARCYMRFFDAEENNLRVIRDRVMDYVHAAFGMTAIEYDPPSLDTRLSSEIGNPRQQVAALRP